jgi:hypothetical protein
MPDFFTRANFRRGLHSISSLSSDFPKIYDRNRCVSVCLICFGEGSDSFAVGCHAHLSQTVELTILTIISRMGIHSKKSREPQKEKAPQNSYEWESWTGIRNSCGFGWSHEDHYQRPFICKHLFSEAQWSGLAMDAT